MANVVNYDAQNTLSPIEEASSTAESPLVACRGCCADRIVSLLSLYWLVPDGYKST